MFPKERIGGDGVEVIIVLGAKRPEFDQLAHQNRLGYKAEQQPVSAHDMHATILHLLGLDHEKLTYRYSGRDYRLSDIDGKPIPQIIA